MMRVSVFAALLLSAADFARAGDAHYSFDNYINMLPLPNGPSTNGTAHTHAGLL